MILSIPLLVAAAALSLSRFCGVTTALPQIFHTAD
jgi:hypothetical protein